MSTATIIRGRTVTRPEVTPLTSSIMDQATVADVDDFGWRSDSGLWPSYNCMDLWTPVGICPTPSTDFKSFSFAEWEPGYSFAVYGGVQCLTPGLDVADQEAQAKRVFLANEGRGVEESLVTNRFIANGGSTSMNGQTITWAGPTDLTPAGKTISLLVALALLEGKAATMYAGVPTIHMPRAAATILSGNGLITWNGRQAYTKAGSKIAMGGGYDVSEADGTWDLYATGEVYIERSGLIEVQSFTSGADGSMSGAGKNGIIPNSTITLVERLYRVAVDCMVLKATGTVWT